MVGRSGMHGIPTRYNKGHDLFCINKLWSAFGSIDGPNRPPQASSLVRAAVVA